MAKNPLDDIVEELVVFKHPQNGYFSNDPRWNDSRIQEHWIKTKSDEAQPDEDEVEDEEVEDELPPYEEWKNEDLRAELLGRKLSLDGTKKEMAARLREDDAKQEG